MKDKCSKVLSLCDKSLGYNDHISVQFQITSHMVLSIISAVVMGGIFFATGVAISGLRECNRVGRYYSGVAFVCNDVRATP